MLCSCSPRTMTTTNPNRPSNNLWVQTCAKLNKDRSASNPRDRKWSIISFTRKSRPEFIAHFSLVSLDTSLICGSLAKTLMFSLVSWSIRAISFRDLSTIIFYHQSVEFSNAISPLSFLVSSGSQHCVGSVALLNVIALSQNWSLLLATVWLTVWFSEKAVQRDNSLSNCNQRHVVGNWSLVAVNYPILTKDVKTHRFATISGNLTLPDQKTLFTSQHSLIDSMICAFSML